MIEARVLPRTEELHALATESVGGSTAWFYVGDAREMQVTVNVTDAPAAFTVLMETRDNDTAQKFYSLPYDLLRGYDTAAADDSAKSEKTKRNLLSSVTTPQRATGIYKHLAAEWVRLKWIGAGSTFAASMALK